LPCVRDSEPQFCYPGAMTENTDNAADVLERLFAVIEDRRDGDTSESYTARLLAEGADRIAQKLGEEAVETVIAGAKGDRAAVITESADLLYHLLVLWAASGVAPGEVLTELARREGRSGLDEKQGRSS
jgi:phosphoribosyl-ATP pyrophosphohydrolase